MATSQSSKRGFSASGTTGTGDTGLLTDCSMSMAPPLKRLAIFPRRAAAESPSALRSSGLPAAARKPLAPGSTRIEMLIGRASPKMVDSELHPIRGARSYTTQWPFCWRREPVRELEEEPTTFLAPAISNRAAARWSPNSECPPFPIPLFPSKHGRLLTSEPSLLLTLLNVPVEVFGCQVPAAFATGLGGRKAFCTEVWPTV